MTMEEQIASHLTFLKEQNFYVNELHIDKGFIRCHAIGQTTDRGELCYQTKKTQLKNGLVGLGTWLRGIGGQVKIHKTYGPSFRNPTNPIVEDVFPLINQQIAVEKAEAFWRMSDQIGEAEYLLRKGVGYYGIRFRQTDYGKIAVVPLRDIAGKFFSYQLINADGSKRFAKDVETKCLLHMLHIPIDGFSIGIAESYVTAATCFELTGMPMATAFSADNLKAVALALRKKFPNSPIIILGDNDRHLAENKGRLAAYAVKNELERCQIAIPEFNDYPAIRDFTDWNDLVREKGIKEGRAMMQRILKMN
jgi:hypothetical protein